MKKDCFLRASHLICVSINGNSTPPCYSLIPNCRVGDASANHTSPLHVVADLVLCPFLVMFNISPSGNRIWVTLAGHCWCLVRERGGEAEARQVRVCEDTPGEEKETQVENSVCTSAGGVAGVWQDCTGPVTPLLWSSRSEPWG